MITKYDINTCNKQTLTAYWRYIAVQYNKVLYTTRQRKAKSLLANNGVLLSLLLLLLLLLICCYYHHYHNHYHYHLSQENMPQHNGVQRIVSNKHTTIPPTIMQHRIKYDSTLTLQQTNLTNSTIQLHHVPRCTTLEQKCAHFCSKGLYCGAWGSCIVAFVKLVYRRHTQKSCHDTVHKKEQNDSLHHNTKMHAAVGQLLHGVHGEEETWRRQEGRQYGEIGGHNDDSKQPVDGDQVTHSAVCWQVNHTWNTDKHVEYRKLRPELFPMRPVP